MNAPRPRPPRPGARRARPVAVLWERLFARHVDAAVGLQDQVRRMMVAAILDGQLPLGQPLPSSRELARRLGVARNTVLLAYRQLVDEGYLRVRARSGHFVDTDMLRGRVGAPGGGAPPPVPQGPGPQWARRLRQRPAAQRNIVKPRDWQRYPYPFLYGQFDPSLFPTAEWRECCAKALSVAEIRRWAPDQIDGDDELLVEQIRTRVLPRRGVFAAADEIVVTAGAQHALYLLAELLVHAGTRVAVEDPCYPDARNLLLARTGDVRALVVDAEGLPPHPALDDCDLVFVTPSHQCPTTVTMPLQRRERLLATATTADFVLVEDDYEAENSFTGEPVPALKSLDRDGRVVYVGSLSKAFAPGLRLGYVVAPPPVAIELRAARRLMLRHPSAFVQRAFALFILLGHYDALLRRLSLAYRDRAAALLQGLARHLPACRPVPLRGGSSCWVQGPADLDSDRLAVAAGQSGVLIEPGAVFFCAADPPRHCFRLGYSAIGTDRIGEGTRLLGAALDRLRARRG
jgi:GntR family transcriptional regulator/MocR family aminotransferase